MSLSSAHYEQINLGWNYVDILYTSHFLLIIFYKALKGSPKVIAIIGNYITELSYMFQGCCSFF